MHLLVLFRLPVMLAGAIVGGFLAGTAYMRLVWRYLERKADQPQGTPSI